MRLYRFLTPASKDLVAVLEYLDGANPSIAERFLSRLNARLTLLAKSPETGHRRPEFGHDELRYITFESYIIAYFPQSTPISIAAIVHGSRDLASLLKTLDRRL